MHRGYQAQHKFVVQARNLWAAPVKAPWFWNKCLVFKNAFSKPYQNSAQIKNDGFYSALHFIASTGLQISALLMPFSNSPCGFLEPN
jgi:hypothetical protein